MRASAKTPLTAYACAFVILLAVFFILEVYPFGSNHFLQVDAVHSYAPRMTELLNKIRNGGSLYYSWQGGVGNNFFSAALTTLMNPLILIGLLLKPEYITELYALILLLEIPLCALTFAYYLNYKFYRGDRYVVLFSLMYSFCSFVTAYHWVFHWIIGVAALPLVASGLERIVRQGKAALYVLSLGIGIISNYMIGLFLCVFSLIYFISLVIVGGGEIALHRGIRKFCIGSALALAISSIVLIPVLISLRYSIYFSGYYSDAPGFSVMFSLLNYFTGHYFLMAASVLTNYSGLPNIYAGLFPFIFYIIYWLHPSFSTKEKIIQFACLFILYLFCAVAYLNFLIHGNHYNNCLPHRFSFIIVFYMLTMAYQAFLHVKDIQKSRVYAAFIFLTMISALLFKTYFTDRKGLSGLFTREIIIANTVLLILYMLLSYYLFKYNTSLSRLRRYTEFFLVALISLEIGISVMNNFWTFYARSDRNGYYIDINKQTEPIRSGLKDEAGFFRMEQLPNRVMSNGKLFNYNGISIFSILNHDIVEFFGKFSADSNINTINYRAADPVLNSILGLKYLICMGDYRDYQPFGFNLIKKQSDIALYENPFALPIGFMAKTDLQDWQIIDGASPFAAAEAFAHKAAGVSGRLYDDPVLMDHIEAEYLSVTANDSGSISYAALDQINDGDGIPSLKYTCVIPKQGHYILKLKCEPVQLIKRVVIEPSGSAGTFEVEALKSYGSDIDLGFLKKGVGLSVLLELDDTLISIDFAENKDGAGIKRNLWQGALSFFYRPKPANLLKKDIKGAMRLYVARINDDTFAEMFGKLQAEMLKVSYYDDTTVRGAITVKEKGLMFMSIPFDKRWRVYVNGAGRPAVKVMDAFLGLPLDEGDYQIELKYQPVAVNWMYAVSALALVYLLSRRI